MTQNNMGSNQLTTPYGLAADQIAYYRAHGYVKLKDALSAVPLARYGNAVTRAVRETTPEQRLEQFRIDYGDAFAEKIQRTLHRVVEDTENTYARAFNQKPNLWRLSSDVETFVRSERLAHIATHLMGVAGVRLYHDQALFKEPHGGHTPWHVDQFYWPLSNANTVTVWIPLQAVPMEMGPVAFAKGSHKMSAGGLASQLAIGDESETLIGELMRDLAVDNTPFELGEVSFHTGWTCHRADPNLTDATRAVFTIIYMDRDIRLIEPQHANHRADARMWVPGVDPGEVAASELNPVLFER